MHWKNNSTPSWSIFDLAKKSEELSKLQKQSEVPGFWDDPTKAQSVMKRIAYLDDTIVEWSKLQTQVEGLSALWELDDGSLTEEIVQQVDELEDLVAKKEISLLLSGQYDRGNAILAIHAGAGGTDSVSSSVCTCVGQKTKAIKPKFSTAPPVKKLASNRSQYRSPATSLMAI